MVLISRNNLKKLESRFRTLNKKGKLIVFSAPSGAGKTTIIKEVLNTFENLKFSISATTRKMRDGETEGVDYFFISVEDFKNKIENSEFIEWENFFGNYYGTLKDFVDKNIENGINLILELDVKGAMNVKKFYNDAVLVFIKPPSIDELRSRLIKRNSETDEQLAERLNRAEYEMEFEKKFDFIVVNKTIEQAIIEVKNIIEIVINKE